MGQNLRPVVVDNTGQHDGPDNLNPLRSMIALLQQMTECYSFYLSLAPVMLTFVQLVPSPNWTLHDA